MRNCFRGSPAGSRRKATTPSTSTILGLGAAPDIVIEARARELRAVIWSKDADFADRGPVGHPVLQVVWLRVGNTTNTSLQARLAPHLSAVEAALESGEFLIEVRSIS